MPVLRRGPRVQRHDVRAGQQRVQRHQFDSVRRIRHLRIVGDDGEAECPCARRHLAADAAEADQAQGEAGGLMAEELLALERRLRETAAVEQMPAGPRHRADQQEGEGDGEFRDSFGVLPRGVDHRDATLGGRRHVHVHRAAAGTAHQA